MRDTKTLETLLDTVTVLYRETEKLQGLCRDIIEASLFWTGEDEEKNPGLKKIRTLAGLYIEEDK